MRFFVKIAVVLCLFCGAAFPQQAPQYAAPPSSATQTAPPPATAAQVQQQYWTGNGGKGMSITIRDLKAVGLGESQSHIPRKVRFGLKQYFEDYSAIEVLIWEDFEEWRNELTDAAYDENSEAVRNATRAQKPTTHLLRGEITKTPTGYDLQIRILKMTDNTTAASYSGTFTFWELNDLTGVGRASLDLLPKMGVALTAKARNELFGAATQDRANEVNGQLALANGISADRRGNKVEALNYYIQAAQYNPSLRARSSVLSADIFSGNMGSDIVDDIQWRKQWVERLKETEEFFDNFNKIESMPYTLFYGGDIQRGATNYQNETVPISMDTYLYGSQVWAHSIARVLQKVYDGLNATKQKEKWGLSNWPQQGVTNLNVFADRRNNFSVVFELLNSRNKVIGRQTLHAGGVWRINLSDHTSIGFGATRERVTFQNVGAADITASLTVRVASVNGIDAETAAINGVLQIRNISKDEFDLNDRFKYAMGQIHGFDRGDRVADLVIPSTIWGDPVTSIGNGAFSGNGLNSVTIPAGVEIIGSGAFWNTGLMSVTIGANVRMGKNSFGGSTFQNFPECYYKNGKQANTYQQSIFRFAVSGEIQGFANSFANAKYITIPDNVWGVPVTSIAEGAFSNYQLISVVIPNRVKLIGQNAFHFKYWDNNRNIYDIPSHETPRITIGANVVISDNSFFIPNFIHRHSDGSSTEPFQSFYTYYNHSGMKPGTYSTDITLSRVLANNLWKYQPPAVTHVAEEEEALNPQQIAAKERTAKEKKDRSSGIAVLICVLAILAIVFAVGGAEGQ